MGPDLAILGKRPSEHGWQVESHESTSTIGFFVDHLRRIICGPNAQSRFHRPCSFNPESVSVAKVNLLRLGGNLGCVPSSNHC